MAYEIGHLAAWENIRIFALRKTNKKNMLLADPEQTLAAHLIGVANKAADFCPDVYTRFLFSAVIDADRLDTEGSDPKAKAAAANRKCWRPFDARALLKQKSWLKLCAKKSVTVAA